MVFYDSSTGVDLGHAQMINTGNKTGKGKVWRTLSKNLLIADCNPSRDTGEVLAMK